MKVPDTDLSWDLSLSVQAVWLSLTVQKHLRQICDSKLSSGVNISVHACSSFVSVWLCDDLVTCGGSRLSPTATPPFIT